MALSHEPDSIWIKIVWNYVWLNLHLEWHMIIVKHVVSEILLLHVLYVQKYGSGIKDSLIGKSLQS